MTDNPTTLGNYDYLAEQGRSGISFSSAAPQGIQTSSPRPKGAFSQAAEQHTNPSQYKDQGVINQFLINIMLLLTGLLDPNNKANGGLIGLISKAFGFENNDDFVRLQKDLKTNGRDSVRDNMDFSRFDRSAALAAARQGQPLVAQNAYGSQMLEVIGKHESGGDYNRVFAHKGIKRVDLTNMSLNQVMDWQRAYVNEQKDQGYSQDNRSAAAGKYQIMRATLAQSMKELGLRGDEKFDEAMQDRIAAHLLEKRGYSAYLEGRKSERDFMKGLSSEWASLPKDASGVGVHDGVGTNKAARNAYGTVLVAAERDQGLSNTFENVRRGPPPETSATVAAVRPERPAAGALAPT